MSQPSFMQRSGVAWWSKTAEPGICQCCQTAKPVFPAFNGGAHLAVRACAICKRPDHPSCSDSAAVKR